MDELKKMRSYVVLGRIETAIYALLGGLLAIAGVIAIAGALPLFVNGIRDITGISAILQLIDRLLLVLVLVELLHTVRISIRSHALVIEPFLIIALIAIIRRVLVLTLHSEKFTGDAVWTPDVQAHFHAAVVEGAMQALLITVLIASIFVVRKTKALEYNAIAEEGSKSPDKAID
ncbi:MAG TPA: phosphate-starvation-inducible PsiE family protein [Granulicella sp.]|jgi:uncharacterized membrane protein (DUF373 family)|nr:phosphate-starvation-inducible PsiE family protein [Granulicella sp.]